MRHGAGEAGVPLGSGGWASVDDVLRAAGAAGLPLDRERLEHVVAADGKRRFSLDGDRIRANQGHSLPVDLDLVPAVPLDVLFHGTHERAAASIEATGLDRRGRHHVHLSADAATARTATSGACEAIPKVVGCAGLGPEDPTTIGQVERRRAMKTGIVRSVFAWYSA